MTTPTILSLGTAVPPYQYNQMDICTALNPAFGNNRRAPAIFRATEIDTRFSVLPNPAWLVDNPGNQARLDYYMQTAPALGIAAIQRALNQTAITPAQITEFIVVSCTGVDTPGLDISIAASMQLSPYLRRTTIVGMGCHALMNGLHTAANAILARPQTIALVLTLELCTLHFQCDNSLKNMLGSALFGDGASAAIVTNTPPGIRLLDSLSYSTYQTQNEMSFHPGDTGYKIHLSGRIADILRDQVPPLVDKLLARHTLTRTDITHWMLHPGGMKIVDYLQEALNLTPAHTEISRTVLRRYGNMSSATLLFVVEETIRHHHPQPGDYGLMLGFGPGLTIEVGLVQW